MLPKTKEIVQTGWRTCGVATVQLWGGGVGEVEMDETLIPLGQLTKERLLSCVNDGKFGCERIIDAFVEVFEVYDNSVSYYRDTVYLDESRCRQGKRGI